MVWSGGLAGVDLRVDCSRLLVGFWFWLCGLSAFCELRLGFLAGLLLAGVWVSGMFLDLDGVGLLLTGVHFRMGLAPWESILPPSPSLPIPEHLPPATPSHYHSCRALGCRCMIGVPQGFSISAVPWHPVPQFYCTT
ncbi:hypothetical protein ATANTOWER_028721 [Ataeniobius toweri]|uniref:Uncharacterized protein n=1 Tax=Ataeniobius toweri TaxID=208326 RepID=A0ABU7ATV3_9TELE|nr:hypothetical protein [Ataeniobius toweri]